MSVASYPTPGPPTTAGHLAPADVAGATLFVTCPPWCTVDHLAEPVAFLEDVEHATGQETVSVPIGGHVEDILRAWVSQYPYLRDDSERAPVLALDATGDGEVAELSRTEALALADQLDAHVERLRGLVATLAEVTTTY